MDAPPRPHRATRHESGGSGSREESGLAKLEPAIDAKDAKPFEAAYRQTMAECHACHKLAAKPYLRPRIPEAPATRIIDMKPGAN